MDESILVAKFQKNSDEEVRAQITTYKGHNLIDLRVFAMKRDGEVPTRKGLTISVDLLPELKEAVISLEAALKNK